MPSSHLESMKPKNAWKLQGAQKGTPKDFDGIKILLHNFGLTWYFSPSELLVTGISTPSMSAYRAGVWCEKPGSLDCEALGTCHKLSLLPSFNLFQGHKGSRQKKKRIFYGQADRKGWPDSCQNCPGQKCPKHQLVLFNSYDSISLLLINWSVKRF